MSSIRLRYRRGRLALVAVAILAVDISEDAASGAFEQFDALGAQIETAGIETRGGQILG